MLYGVICPRVKHESNSCFKMILLEKIRVDVDA